LSLRHTDPANRQAPVIYDTLISVDELARHIRDPHWIVFDCRHDLAQPGLGEEQYAASHIPGAHFMRLDHDLAGAPSGKNGRHPLPDARAFARKLGEAGVEAASQVVAYDAQGGMFAARLWWMLRCGLGHPAVAVLDGGWAGWCAQGLPQSADLPHSVPARFEAWDFSGAVNVGYVLEHLRGRGMTLIDARAADRYRGENETLDPVAGHIPGALNRPFRDNLDRNGRFKSGEQLRREFRDLLGGANPDAVVHQCGSGVTACHNALAMEHAGLKGSRLYPGSWSEWCADPARPIARESQA
jgi:thiosulfate/3-mercaptopyruvate sulfurtransferase